MLGLTQQQMAELIGVTYQQAHKYEKGTNRVAAGRLHAIAQVLGVGVGYFYEGLEVDESPEVTEATTRQRVMLGLARDFVALPDRRHQEIVCQLARGLAGLDQREAGPGESNGPSAAARPV